MTLPHPVFTRRKPRSLPELAGEIIAVVEAHIEGDFGDLFVRMAQQAAGSMDPLVDQPCERRGAGCGLEDPQETPA